MRFFRQSGVTEWRSRHAGVIVEGLIICGVGQSDGVLHGN